MTRIIGFDRKVQLSWMDLTAGLCREGLEPDAIAERLDQRLADEIQGDEARRKTITVLKRVWGTVSDNTSEALHKEALRLIADVGSEERLWLHWGMSLVAYPFFRDVAGTVGQLGRLQGALDQAQVQRRMVEGWGDRTTLTRAVQRLLRTLVEWDALRDTEEQGQYELAPLRRTDNSDLALWMLECALASSEAEQLPLAELGRLSYLFPFDVAPVLADVRRSERFRVSRQGLDLDMVSVTE